MFESGRPVVLHVGTTAPRFALPSLDGGVAGRIKIVGVEPETAPTLYGPLLVLHHLAKKIHLPDQLGPYSQEILSLVYAPLPRLPQPQSHAAVV